MLASGATRNAPRSLQNSIANKPEANMIEAAARVHSNLLFCGSVPPLGV